MNRRSALALALPLIATHFASAEAAGAPMASDARSSLLGSWTVDLRPTPTSSPYLKKLVVTSVEGTRIEGHFYDGSPLQFGRINSSASSQLCFAFITDPGEGAYASSGRQVAPDRLEGMTLSTTRGFLLPWIAMRDAG